MFVLGLLTLFADVGDSVQRGFDEFAEWVRSSSDGPRRIGATSVGALFKYQPAVPAIARATAAAAASPTHRRGLVGDDGASVVRGAWTSAKAARSSTAC